MRLARIVSPTPLVNPRRVRTGESATTQNLAFATHYDARTDADRFLMEVDADVFQGKAPVVESTDSFNYYSALPRVSEVSPRGVASLS